MRTLSGGGSTDDGTGVAFDTSADALDDSPSVGSEVHEHPPAVDGVGTAEGQLCRDQSVDDAGGRGGRECGVGGDLAHAASASAGEHQQDAPAVSADTFGSGDGGQGGRNRAVKTVEQIDETCYSRRRDR